MTQQPQIDQAVMQQRRAYYERIGTRKMAPLWEVLHALVIPQPKSACMPAIWHYADIRDDIMEAGRLITAKEAERRVLILENPGMPGQSRITTSLYAGLQLILPGEVAPAHRHTQSALRFIVEGDGAYTAVDGEKTIMHEGDFVITPSWTWHDHGNDSDGAGLRHAARRGQSRRCDGRNLLCRRRRPALHRYRRRYSAGGRRSGHAGT